MNINIENRTLFHGNNLEILQGINSASVDLIYLDPPFNKNKTFKADRESRMAGATFDDVFMAEDVKPEWIEVFEQAFPNVAIYLETLRKISSSSFYGYLGYMAIRLVECHRILKSKGSIYLHCDSTMSHYLKLLMDCIWGVKNFKNEIIWKRTSSHNGGKTFGRVADTILFYGPGIRVDGSVRVPLNEDYVSKAYRNTDERGRYCVGDLTAKKLTGSGYTYDFHGHSGPWRFPENRMKELAADGRIHFPKKPGGAPGIKRYLHENKGQIPGSIWTDIDDDTVRVPLDEDYIKDYYRHEDERGRYRVGDLKGFAGDGYTYDFHGHSGPWRFPEHRMKALEADNRIHIPKKAGGVPGIKRYLHENKGQIPGSIWTDIDNDDDTVRVPLREEYVKASYRYKDDRGRYRPGPLDAPYGEGYSYEYKGHPGPWRCPIETMKALDADDRLVPPASVGGRVNRKLYLHENKGQIPGSIWTDIDNDDDDTVRAPLDEEYINQYYRHNDERGRYIPVKLTAHVSDPGRYMYDFHGHPGPWGRTEESMKALEADGRIHLPKKPGGIPRLKLYLHENKGQIPASIWTDIPNVKGGSKERTGYPTQKPVALLERIIKASSEKGDVVLDPFCGSGTTCLAAERLGRQWIGIDQSQYAIDLARDRIAGVGDDANVDDLLACSINIQVRSDLPERKDA